MHTALDILKQYWGYESFRPKQAEIINSVLQGNDTLALLPTGGGKSICYQVPALVKDGLCLVISPLIALMQDQVARLKKQEVPAACLYAGMHYMEVKRVLSSAVHGGYRLLYVSPERLQTHLFQDYLPELDISLIAIDEAHCISQWGHDFRPDYLKIAEIKEEFPKVPILALTASATKEVQEDIIKQLQLKKPAVFEESFERKNIFYEIRYSENKAADTLNNINDTESTIIYCRSRKQTELAGSLLNKNGIPAAHYHAGLGKDRRQEVQDEWMGNVKKVIAATTAFGMGIDKPDVRMELHYDAPEHLEAYYQEAGRAGRDGKSSRALLLYNRSDIKRLESSTAIQYPVEAYLRQVYQSVTEYLQIPIGNQPDKYYSFELTDFCRKFKLETLPASYALRLLAQEGLWTITESVFHPATIHFTTDRHTLDNIANKYHNLGIVTTTLLRLHNTIFHFPTIVRINSIARHLKISPTELEAILMRLENMGMLEYVKPNDGPELYFHSLRVDSRHLLLNMRRISILRQKHIARTEAMITFLQNDSLCRERMMLTYFGEQPDKDCGHCDVCRANGTTGQTNNKKLREELNNMISDKGTMNITEIINKCSGYPQENVSTVLRQMVEEKLLHWHPDGTLAWNRK